MINKGRTLLLKYLSFAYMEEYNSDVKMFFSNLTGAFIVMVSL